MINQYEPLFGELEREAVNEYMLNPGYMTEFKKTEEFENEISKYLGVKHTILCNNGTISLSLALLALGIKPGDKVIVPNLTMIATINAVVFIGAIPVLVDVDSQLLLDTNYSRLLILTDPTIKAVIFVSLNGRTLSQKNEDFITFCKEHNVGLIDDAAQSFGSNDYSGVKIGNKCDICSFSFSMPKIICSGGQGGALTTNNDDLAFKLRRLKDFGRASGGNDTHDSFGINSKFTEFQAVVGLTQLKTIEWRTKKKIEMYNRYKENLKDVSGISFIPTDLSYCVPWFMDIFIDEPKILATYLLFEGIKTRLIYPPINTQKVNQGLYNCNEEFPISEAYCNMGIWLPSSLSLTNENIDYICGVIRRFYVR